MPPAAWYCWSQTSVSETMWRSRATSASSCIPPTCEFIFVTLSQTYCSLNLENQNMRVNASVLWYGDKEPINFGHKNPVPGPRLSENLPKQLVMVRVNLFEHINRR